MSDSSTQDTGTPPTTTLTIARRVDRLFERGDRVLVGSRRAVVKRSSGHTLTIAYRDSRFWRLAWWLQDVYWKMRVRR